MTPHELINAERRVGDPALRCPECDYILTGLSEPRCPECGTPFNPLAISGFTGEPQPATPWDRTGGPIGFFHTLILSLVHPWSIGNRFPRWHDARRAAAYARWNLVLWFVVYATGCLLVMDIRGGGRITPHPFGLFMFLVFGAASLLVLVWLSAAFLDAILPRVDLPDSIRYYHGLVHYSSGFLLPFALTDVLLAAGPRDWFGVRIGTEECLLVAGCVVVWWILSLTIMATRRSEGFRDWLAMPALLAAVLGAGLAGFVVSVIVSLVLSPLSLMW